MARNNSVFILCLLIPFLMGSTLENDKFIPLKGSFEVYVAEVLQEEEPRIHLLQGRGNLSRFGEVEVYFMENWFADEVTQGQGWGEIRLTTTRGDVLVASFTGGEFKQKSPGLEELSIPFTIDGTASSGDFEGAEGKFTWRATFNPEENKGQAKIIGKIAI